MGLKFKGNKRESVYSAMLNNLAYANSNSILAGCKVNPSTPNAMTVDVDNGKIFFGNDIINVIASTNTLTIDTEPSSNTRIDLVLVDNTGTLSILKGTASAIPATPDYNPDNYIALALITVDKNTTTITNDNIKDLRVLNQGGAGGNSGTFGRYIKEFTSQTTVNVNHNLADDEPNVFVYDDNDTLIIPESVTVNDINNLTVTFSTNTSGKIIVYGGVGLNNAYYTEEFNSSLTWNVNHNLNNKYVNVTCFNTSDEIIEPSNITITDENNLTIDWGSNTAGRVVVTGGTAQIELSKMTDVNISSPKNNDLLQYDSASGKWINVSSFNNIYKLSGLNIIRQLQNRSVDFSGDGEDWFADAYVDSNGRNNYVYESNTTASYDSTIDTYTVFNKNFFIVIEANNFTGTDYGDVKVREYDSHKYVVYTELTDVELSRAKVLEYLFKPSDLNDGSSARIKTDFTNITSIKTTYTDDIGKRINYAYLSVTVPHHSGSTEHEWGKYLGTFSNTTSNDNCFVWSYTHSDEMKTVTYFPDGTIVNDSPDDTSHNEYGTDTSSEKRNNPSTVSMKIWVTQGWYNESATCYAHLITINKDTINWSYTEGGDGSHKPSSHIAYNYDFYNNGGIPLFSDGSNEVINSFIYHTIPSGTFSSSTDTSFLTCLVDNWEDGANIQYKLTNASEDSGWLDYNEVSSFTAFTNEPTTLIIKLIPKSSNPTTNTPSIKGYALITK